ncbi:MAG: hypothetical protein J5521_00715 [Lachnospiraceae bacterium]|nr:hypothetical protein [Lachnospiraceae bacterium]MBR4414946.1 hypothetical protein [Aeriscardovia sp.]
MSEKNYMVYGDAETIFTGYANRIKLSPTTFVGTQAEWNNLSASEKAEYVLVDITDDESSLSGMPRFPDYSNPITVSGSPWVATEDCYISYTLCNGSYSADNRLQIDGNVVSTYSSAGGTYVHQFNGYVKEGQIVTAYDVFSLKVFPLLGD